MRWLIRVGENEYSASSVDELKAFYLEGRINPADYVYHPVLEKWMYVKDLEELREELAFTGPRRPPPVRCDPSLLRAADTKKQSQQIQVDPVWVPVLVVITRCVLVIGANLMTSTAKKSKSNAASAAPSKPTEVPTTTVPPKSPPGPPTASTETRPHPQQAAPARSSGNPRQLLDQVVAGLAPMFDGYEIVGPVSVHMKLNPRVWNSLSPGQQRQLMDFLAGRQIVRDIGMSMHIYVYSTKVGKISPGFGNEWKFRPE